MKILTKQRFLFGLLMALILWSEVSVAQQKIKLAILYFKNSSNDVSLGNFVDDLPDMLMTDLGRSQEIILVERAQIDEAIRNFKIEKSNYFNISTAVKVGKWIGANVIVLGNFTSIGENARIDSRIIDVKTGTSIKSKKVQGKKESLFELVDSLAEEILKVLTDEHLLLTQQKKVLLDRQFEISFPSLGIYRQYNRPKAVEDSELYSYYDPEDGNLWFKLLYTSGTVYSGNEIEGWVEITTIYIEIKCSEKYKKFLAIIESDGKMRFPESHCGRLRTEINIIDKQIDGRNTYQGYLQSIKWIKFHVKIIRTDI